MVAIAGIALGGAGCKKSAAPASSAPTFQHLPEATNVVAALNQKDWEAAVGGYGRLKETVTTPEQEAELAVLSKEVRTTLLEAAETDPKASEALQAFRMVLFGR
jgi:hypothetical protein